MPCRAASTAAATSWVNSRAWRRFATSQIPAAASATMLRMSTAPRLTSEWSRIWSRNDPSFQTLQRSELGWLLHGCSIHDNDSPFGDIKCGNPLLVFWSSQKFTTVFSLFASWGNVLGESKINLFEIISFFVSCLLNYWPFIPHFWGALCGENFFMIFKMSANSHVTLKTTWPYILQEDIQNTPYCSELRLLTWLGWPFLFK